MAANSNESTTALLLRDGAGDIYLLTEEMIRACRATPEQQQAVREKLAGQDVVGYALTPASGSLVTLGAITVAPQINTNVGVQVAAANFAPVNQALGQTGLNVFTIP